MNIGGAFLNAYITGTGIKVHMRLNRMLTAILVLIDPKLSGSVEEQGTSVVELDKTFYGYVEAVALWYTNLCATTRENCFDPHLYGSRVYITIGMDDTQIIMVMHVDTLIITSIGNDEHEIEVSEKHEEDVPRD